MDKLKTFQFVFDALNKWAEEQKKNGKRTVEMQLHLGDGFCGELLLHFPRPGKQYEDALMGDIFNDDDTLRLSFDSVEELIRRLEEKMA